METADKLIPILKTLGFIQIPMYSAKTTDYKEIVEYFDGKNWRIFGLK